MRAGLHHDPVLEEDVGGAQHVLALVDEERDVMQTATRVRQVAGVGEVVGLLVGREPDARFRAVVEHDLLGEPQAEVCLEERAVLARVDREEVDVIEVPHADAAAGIALRLVLQRGAELGRRLVALGLVEELDAVAVGVEEAVGATVTEVAVEPAARRAARLERGNATVERLGAVRAVREVADAGLRPRASASATTARSRRSRAGRPSPLLRRRSPCRGARESSGGSRRASASAARRARGARGREWAPSREVPVRVGCARCSARRSASAMIVSDGLTESVRGTSEPSPT